MKEKETEKRPKKKGFVSPLSEIFSEELLIFY